MKVRISLSFICMIFLNAIMLPVFAEEGPLSEANQQLRNMFSLVNHPTNFLYDRAAHIIDEAYYNTNCTIPTNYSIWYFALIVTLLDDALNAATDDAFGVKDACGPLAAADWIDIHNLPVLINMDDFYSHYLVAYGYGGISDTWGGNISQKNLYFLITDNGHLIGYNNYDPYWRRNIWGEAYYRIKHNI